MSTLTINDYLHDGVSDLLAAIFFAAVFGFLPPDYLIDAAALKQCYTACLFTWSGILLTCRQFNRITMPCLQLAKSVCITTYEFNNDGFVHDIIDWSDIIPKMVNRTPRMRRKKLPMFFGFASDCYASFYISDRYTKIVSEYDRAPRCEVVIRKRCVCAEEKGILGFKYCKQHTYVRYKCFENYLLDGTREEFVADRLRIVVDTDVPGVINVNYYDHNMHMFTAIVNPDHTLIMVERCGKMHIIVEHTHHEMSFIRLGESTPFNSIVYEKSALSAQESNAERESRLKKGTSKDEILLYPFYHCNLPRSYEEGNAFIKTNYDGILRWCDYDLGQYCVR